MTWPLASTLLVGVCVVAALAWFERSRPAPRQVALIAALAALAVAGRVAFAPIPSVKPTTDIVLLAGYVFGAVPGLVIGATTALASNIVFGQGLHTPWQMLGWGGVGLAGGLVGRLGPARPPGLILAACCAIAALGFSAFMDLSVWAQTAPGHTLADYAAISARGLPFTAAHVVGSALFALAFGPVTVRALRRARARSTIRWLAVTKPIVPTPEPKGQAADCHPMRKTSR